MCRTRFCILVRLFVLFCNYGTAILKAVDPRYTPDEICVPNPRQKQSLRFSAPFETCREAYKQAVLSDHPDKHKSTGEIIESYGYPYKVYKVTSEDGYILTSFRITGSPAMNKSQIRAKKPAVLLMHGMSLASDCWLFQPGTRNLPFKLASAGYEVWLGNARGTTYSLEHETLNAQTDLEYWNFDWHEMGIYDLPVLADQIIEVSGNPKIFYAGHSMGSTSAFVGLSEIPSLNKKFQAVFMITPQAYMGHMNNFGRAAAPLVSKHERYLVLNKAFGGRMKSSNDYKKAFGTAGGDFCELSAAKCGACDNAVFAILGYNAEQMNNSALPLIMTKLPNTFPIKCLAHYTQAMTTCTFRHYDHGPVENMIRYNHPTPPDYPLEKIKAPLYFFYAEQDSFAPPNDVNTTASKLSPGVLKGQYLAESEFFTHGDYATAKDADKYVYDKIVEIIESYRK